MVAYGRLRGPPKLPQTGNQRMSVPALPEGMDERAGTIEFLRARLAGLYTPGRLVAVMLLQAVLLAGHIATSWHAGPDSALYMGLGRSLAEGQGYVFNHEPHTMVPPLYPLLLAGVMKLAGPSYLALNISQVVLALACTPLAFWLLRRWFGPDLAIVGAGLFALGFCLWNTASMVISDLLFTALALGGMLAAEWAASRGRSISVMIAGALIGAASLTRITGATIVPGAVIAIWLGWPGRSRLARAAACIAVGVLAAAPLLAWQQWAASARTGGVGYLEMSLLNRPLGQMLTSVSMNLLVELPEELSALVLGLGGLPVGASLLVPALAVVSCVVCLRRRVAMLPATLAAMLVPLAVVPGVRMRYLLFLQPGLIVLVLVGIVALVRRAAPRGARVSPGARTVILLGLGLVAAMHVGRSAGRLWRYRCDEVPGGHRIGSRQGWFTASEYIAARAPNAVVMTRHPGVVHYLTRARTLGTKYAREPSAAQYAEFIRAHRPEYLLAEAPDERTARVLEGFGLAGAHVQRVQGMRLTGKITLWRVSYPDDRGSAASAPATGSSSTSTSS